MRDIHTKTVGGIELKGIIDYQSLVCRKALETALQKQPPVEQAVILRECLETTVIPLFKIILAAQLKGLLILTPVLGKTAPAALNELIKNMLKVMAAMKEWFAALSKEYKNGQQKDYGNRPRWQKDFGNLWHISQVLFFHRLPTTTAELEQTQGQSGGAKIYLREGSTNSYIGFGTDGKASLFKFGAKEAELLWREVGDGKVVISNQAKTFYLYGQQHATVHARVKYWQDWSEGKIQPSVVDARLRESFNRIVDKIQVELANKAGLKIPEAFRFKTFFPHDLRGEAIEVNNEDKKARYTPCDWGDMYVALKDSQGNLVYENGQVFGFDKQYWMPNSQPPQGTIFPAIKFDQLSTAAEKLLRAPDDLRMLHGSFRNIFCYVVEPRN